MTEKHDNALVNPLHDKKHTTAKSRNIDSKIITRTFQNLYCSAHEFKSN